MSKEVKLKITYLFDEERVFVDLDDLQTYPLHQQFIALDDIIFQLQELSKDISTSADNESEESDNVINFPLND